MTKLLTIAKYLGISLYAQCGILLAIFLLPTGWKALTVQTGSMNPTIAPGSLVIIHRTAAADLAVRDIATYINPANQAQTITHRIVAVKADSPRTFVFKGDANPGPDPNDIVAGRVVGKVVWHIPGLGNLMNALRQPLVLTAIIVIPGLLVIGAELRTLGRLLYGQPLELVGPSRELVSRPQEPDAGPAPTPKPLRSRFSFRPSRPTRAATPSATVTATRSLDGMRRQI